jgi:hypothetical protein
MLTLYTVGRLFILIRMSHGKILLVLLSFVYLCFWTIFVLIHLVFVFIENSSVGIEVLTAGFMKSCILWDNAV